MKFLANNDFVEYRWDDFYLYVEFSPNLRVTLDIAKQNTDLRRLVTRDKDNYCVIMDLSNVTSTTREARNHYLEEQVIENVTAIAVLTPNPLSNFMFNVMTRLSKFSIPIKRFTNKEEASDWLRTFIKNG